MELQNIENQSAHEKHLVIIRVFTDVYIRHINVMSMARDVGVLDWVGAISFFLTVMRF